MRIDHYLDAISSTKLFRGFSKAELTEIFHTSKYEIRKYKKDEIIHLQNEICHTMDLILCGKVTVQNIDENGNVLTINVFADGENIGANIIFSSRNFYPMTIAAISEVTILHMKKELVMNLCQTNTTFMGQLLQEISDRTIILTDKITSISMKTIRQCILDFLKYEYFIQNSKVIKLSISKKDLAERLGIQRTSLSRELNKMRKDGLIDYDTRTIRLIDDNIIYK